MADWATISSLATAGGTLVLAAATFASVKSANRSARIAHADPEQVRLLQRDLFVPAGATGYWHASLRDPDADMYRELRPAIEERQAISIELLYGDFEGGQRTITRFGVLPRGDGWSAA